ncbi:MAG: hypothetical protein HPY30_14430 [Gammaproteobacteria bacterium (ex Lamellibrachia satsuma)]|nr:MAG: hypothetical protein HPY30_14430 [Gammaproteobacteria bacterium (ex Lamellibrachia satsuma)]
MSTKQWRAFKDLRDSTLKTARAWAIKEYGMSLWYYVNRTWAETGFRGKELFKTAIYLHLGGLDLYLTGVR